MIAFRLFRVILHLLAGLLTCGLIFPFIGTPRRMALIRRWSVRLVGLCGITLEIHQSSKVEPARRALIVANHVSWLDIFVINCFHPARFVAKSEIRGWPVVGWLCDKAGTIFIARGKIRDMRRIHQGLVENLRTGEHVAFFPEGTTSSQGVLLPFHANLFEAAIEAEVPVQPYALRYVDATGQWHPAVEFIGDTTFGESLLAILRARGIRAQLLLLAPVASSGAPNRRALAGQVHQAIENALRELPEDSTPLIPKNQMAPGR